MGNKIRSLYNYLQVYNESVRTPEIFWSRIAENFFWRKRWDSVLEWDNFEGPDVKWFVNAKLNITENLLDRHLFALGNRPALVWEANDPDEEGITLTYAQLHAQVCQFSNVLKANGVAKGDRVIIYMPMVPEAAVAMLACARIGAVHSVVFAGFSASALADRIADCNAKVVITADGNFRGSKTIPVKAVVDEAADRDGIVEKVIVLRRTGTEVSMQAGRDLWWHEEIAAKSRECEAVETDSEDPLFILYTSGSTGKPKGVVHTCGGYMVYTKYTFENVFQYEPGDVYWCTADIGWVTGHSYIIYGPLLTGATTLMFEGVPTYPDAGRFWQICEKHKVNQFYTAPTAIRALEALGTEHVAKHDLSSLKVLGTVGEPINVEAWQWYHSHVGKHNCPIVDSWWQTETGGIMISPIAGITPTKPTYATLPLPGIQPVIVDADGKEMKGNNVEGNLCIRFPWPGMIRTIYGDHQRCKDTYFSAYKGMYFTGDGVKRDEDGYYRILGRVDDVINVSGHRLGTAEVENAINQHPAVVESAVIGYAHDIKGQGIYAFVICEKGTADDEQLREEIRKFVNREIGPIAKPEKIQVVPELPKTRSGKIMRRILRKVAEGRHDELGDTSTLLNPEIVEQIIAGSIK